MEELLGHFYVRQNVLECMIDVKNCATSALLKCMTMWVALMYEVMLNTSQKLLIKAMVVFA